MKESVLILMILMQASSLVLARWAGAEPVRLKTDGLTAPLGIDVPQPTFSWRSAETTPNWTQSSYEILIAPEGTSLIPGKTIAWDSGRVNSSESVGIPYAGKALIPQQRYVWKVMTWDKHGKMSASKSAWFETGLLKAADWKAEWVGRRDPDDDAELKAIRWLWLSGADPLHVASATSAQFAYHLSLGEVPSSASLHVMARGSFVARVNGSVTGHHDLWGAFDREEITSLLHRGDNIVEIDMTSTNTGNASLTAPSAVAASLRITAPDGTQRRLVTNKDWQARSSPNAPWQNAQVIGPLSLSFGIGADRQQPIPGPERITTGASLLRKKFSLQGKVKYARLSVTALGAYQGTINGRAISPNTLLSPGWTDFHKRTLYQTYDVTSMLQSGSNALGMVLGGGWHGSPMTWTGMRYTPGPDLMLAQLDIAFEDGRKQQIISDASWKTAAAPITFSEIYGGESFDARLLQSGWTSASFDDQGWAPAFSSVPPDSGMAVTAEPDLPISTVMTLHPAGMSSDPVTHATIFDMGQNMVGNARLHVRGPRGLVARLRFAERLTPDGGIYTENLRNADATDTYVLDGSGDETWSPTFTFHGFRYVELTFLGGSPSSTPTRESIEGLVYNSLPPAPTVRLASSSPLLNKMNELGAWGQRGNFFSIPTDCPQRDERLGWMGDAGVFWRTGSYNFDTQAFTNKFMLDVVDAQEPTGAFTDVSPNILGPLPGAPGWGDAGILIPYAAWLQYGDLSVLKQSWPAMQRWMAFILQNNPEYLRRKGLGNNFGDWLAPDDHTPKDLIGTAYWSLNARYMVEMAKVLHRDQDADLYQQQYERIAAAFRTAYIKADGTVDGNTQASYLAAIFTGIAPTESTVNMVQRLKDDLHKHGDHLTTGFLGTPFLLPVLDQSGNAALAFELLLSDTYPSWGYMVKNGATTWWERWNGDSGDPAMNSYNHYAFGSVMAWVYRRAAGIDTDGAGPGFHHIIVQPHFTPKLPQLHVEYDSAYGTIISDWQQSSHRFSITIPANTTATVLLVGRAPIIVGSGTHVYTVTE